MSSLYPQQHIVLDLDQSLVGVLDESEWMKIYNRAIVENDKQMLSRLYNIDIDGRVIYGILREYAKQFITYCCSRFKSVSVWSAGTELYVHKTCDILLSNVNIPVVIFTRKDCEEVITEEGDKLYIKHLKRVYNYPDLKGKANPKNTFLLDDKYKVTYEDSSNQIVIPEFDVEDDTVLYSEDKTLLYAINYFNNEIVKRCTNVRGLATSQRLIFNI